MTTRRTRSLWATLGVLSLVIAACGGDDDAAPVDEPTESETDDTAAEEPDTAIAEPADDDDEPDDEEEVTIDYFTFSAAPNHLDELDQIIAAFNEEYPNISIEVQTAPYDDYWTSLQTQLAGGAAPDTFELDYERFVTYARAGALLDIGPLVSELGVDLGRYYPLAVESFNDGGVQYGLPTTFSDVVLIYNKALFDAAGLEYPTADWTWEDEVVAAEQLTDLDAGVYGAYQSVSFHEFYKALAQAGGTFFDEDGNAAFNSAAGVAAAEWLASKPGTVMPTLADIGGTPDYDTSLFSSGKLAMWHMGIWRFDVLNEAGVDYDIVVEPGQAQKANAVFMNGAVASSDTEHPEAAAAWIAFLTGSPTTVDVRLASSWELPAVNDEAAFATYLDITPPENRQAVFDALDNIALPPVIERHAEMQDIVGQALERIVLDEADPQEVLDEAAAEVDAIAG